MAYKEKEIVAIEISITSLKLPIIDQLEHFFGNFMVTVLLSVGYAVTEAFDLKNNSCLQYDRSPHETIDRGT